MDATDQDASADLRAGIAAGLTLGEWINRSWVNLAGAYAVIGSMAQFVYNFNERPDRRPITETTT